MNILYYTPHIVNWHSGAANARMPMLEELVRRGHHITLARKKHQRPKATSHPDLPERSFTQLNLEYEWLKQCKDAPFQIDSLSKTDMWMRHNLVRNDIDIRVEWPEVDVVMMEPFAVFPANQLFQMALLQHYTPGTPVMMYDMDLGHGATILGRWKKLMYAYYERAVENITVLSMHDERSLYPQDRDGKLDISYEFEPFGAWDPRSAALPMHAPSVDLVFVGRDLFRRPRMKELVLKPSEMGITVRVHGKYPDDFKADWPKVQWHEEVPPRDLVKTIQEGLCTIVILQSKQATIGFYPVRFVDGAISGAIQLVDAKIKNVAQWSLTEPVMKAENVVEQVQLYKGLPYTQRVSVAAQQVSLFRSWMTPFYVDRLENVLNGLLRRTPA